MNAGSALEAWFLKKVENKAECWIWKGRKDRDGYGRAEIKAHRLAWLLLRGDIPDGLVVDHLCRVRGCVNPEHMEIVTNKINASRGRGACSRHTDKKACPAGHPYSKVTKWRTAEGKMRACRQCLICMKAASRRSYLKKLGAKP